jgi:hypothetical protein
MAMSVLAERRVSGEAKNGMTKNLVQIGEKLSDLGIIVIGDGSAVTNTIFKITQQQPIRFMQFANDYSQAFKAI